MAKPKLIDTWHYSYKGVDSTTPAPEDLEYQDGSRPSLAPEVKVPIKVYLDKTFEDCMTPPQPVKSVQFVIECDKPAFKLCGPNIELLRQAMFEKLDDHFAVKWKWFFKVSIKPTWPRGDSAGLEFEYERVEQGTAHDGSLLMRVRNYRHEAEILPWPGRFTDRGGQQIACIEATDDNEAALKSFAQRIHEMRKVLADYLRPEEICKTLQMVANLPGLPALGSSL